MRPKLSSQSSRIIDEFLGTDLSFSMDVTDLHETLNASIGAIAEQIEASKQSNKKDLISAQLSALLTQIFQSRKKLEAVRSEVISARQHVDQCFFQLDEIRLDPSRAHFYEEFATARLGHVMKQLRRRTSNPESISVADFFEILERWTFFAPFREQNLLPDFQQDMHSRIQHIFSKLESKSMLEFKQALAEIGWPATTEVNFANVAHVESCVETLCKLQFETEKLSYEFPKRACIVLDCLCEPIEKRFQYNFYGDVKTNDVTRPEWFFKFILDVIEKHLGYIQKVIVPVRADIWMEEKTPFEQRFVERILQLAREKCASLIDKLKVRLESSETEETTKTLNMLLGHLTQEMVRFDGSLQAIWNLWFKASPIWWNDDLLSNTWLLDTWIKYEKDSINDTLDELDEMEFKWMPIDYKEGDLQTVGDQGLTKTADFFLELMNRITPVLQSFRDLKLRHRFIKEIQIPLVVTIFLPYCEDENIYGILNSLSYLKKILTSWGDQMLYLEVWYMLTHDLTSPEQCTSIYVQAQPDFCELRGSVFDESILKIEKLTEEIQQKWIDEHFESFRDSVQRFWSLTKSSSASSSVAATFEDLGNTLKKAQSNLVASIFRGREGIRFTMSQFVDNLLVNEVIKKTRSINADRIAQVLFDLRLVLKIWSSICARPESLLKLTSDVIFILEASDEDLRELLEQFPDPIPPLPGKTLTSILTRFGVSNLRLQQVVDLANAKLKSKDL